MGFNFFSTEILAFLNVLLSVITFWSLVYARKKFFPGMFRTLLDLLAVTVLFIALNEMLKLMVALNTASAGAVFEIMLVFPMLVNVILLLIAYRAVKMAEVYGFAGNPPVFLKPKGARARGRK